VRAAFALLVVSLVSCRKAQQAPANEMASHCETGDGQGGCALWGASLIELIARPEQFDGKAVRVIGFVNFEFEGNGLYVSRNDWEHSIARNGVWIDPPSGFDSDSAPSRKSPNQEYVIVEGIFNAANRGHMGMWSGAIERVSRLEGWAPTANIMKTTPR